MSFVLRDYQQQASDKAVAFFNDKLKKTNAIMFCRLDQANRLSLLILPTG